MSRRRKKHKPSSGWFGIAAISVILIGVGGAAILYYCVRSYLHSDAFRLLLSSKASAAARVSGTFQPFQWDGLSVRSSGFDATGTGPVKTVSLTGLRTDIGLNGIRRGVWIVSGTHLQRLDLSLDSNGAAALAIPPQQTSPPSPATPSKPTTSSWLPEKIELQTVHIDAVSLRSDTPRGPLYLSNVRTKIDPIPGSSQSWKLDLSGGKLTLPTLLPEIRLDRAKLRHQQGVVFLNQLDASAWENGNLTASGEWSLKSHQFSLEGNASNVKCSEIFNETWTKRFSGDAATDFHVHNLTGTPEASGTLTIRNGVLTALPILDVLAAYADTRRFRTISLNDAQTRWRWKPGQLQLTRLSLGCEGLVRLEGDITIHDEQIDGTFRLGLVPGTLSQIPGAETDVFLPGDRGLLWAPLRITGTLSDPKEDLTDRLVLAAGMRMFEAIPETGEKVLRFSQSILGEKRQDAVQKGVEILQQGNQIIQGAGDATGVIGGVLGGLLGTPQPPTPETKIPAGKPDEDQKNE